MACSERTLTTTRARAWRMGPCRRRVRRAWPLLLRSALGGRPVPLPTSSSSAHTPRRSGWPCRLACRLHAPPASLGGRRRGRWGQALAPPTRVVGRRPGARQRRPAPSAAVAAAVCRLAKSSPLPWGEPPPGYQPIPCGARLALSAPGWWAHGDPTSTRPRGLAPTPVATQCVSFARFPSQTTQSCPPKASCRVGMMDCCVGRTSEGRHSYSSWREGYPP